MDGRMNAADDCSLSHMPLDHNLAGSLGSPGNLHLKATCQTSARFEFEAPIAGSRVCSRSRM